MLTQRKTVSLKTISGSETQQTEETKIKKDYAYYLGVYLSLKDDPTGQDTLLKNIKDEFKNTLNKYYYSSMTLNTVEILFPLAVVALGPYSSQDNQSGTSRSAVAITTSMLGVCILAATQLNKYLDSNFGSQLEVFENKCIDYGLIKPTVTQTPAEDGKQVLKSKPPASGGDVIIDMPENAATKDKENQQVESKATASASHPHGLFPSPPIPSASLVATLPPVIPDSKSLKF